MGRMKWPPRLARTDILGEVKDGKCLLLLGSVWLTL